VADPGGRGLPVAPSAGALRPLGTHEVRLEPGFWADRQRLGSEVVAGHCLDWMTRLGWVGNFRLAAEGRPPAERRGREFSDSEVYKLLEALCWDAGRTGSHAAEQQVAELTGLLAAAQEPDGYLNTRFGHQGPGARYADLEHGHELYCSGHLIQAAVARLRTRGEDRLVSVARRVADHVCEQFGPDGRVGICGHPEIEPALAELARATGEQRYLEQARLFVERRGRGVLGDHELGQSYFQDDLPVRQATVLRGHAVRALYLACGAVDVAVETGDDELLQAVAGQWRNTVAARTYLTGGMGSRHTGESFGEDFELPTDRAYAETCAGVAAVMLAWRLLLATGESHYADAIERTLYNVVAASPALDGRAFFYANPLQQRVPGRVVDSGAASPHAALGLRSPWFAVSCCPTNLARTLASLAGYVATVDQRGVQLQQLTACTVRTTLPDGRAVGLRVETGYPWEGAVTVRVEEAAGGPFGIALRVPSWADGAVLAYGDDRRRVPAGYAALERPWRPGDEVRLDLPLAPRWTRPDPRIDAVRGCVAVERGPLVYCAESLADRTAESGQAAAAQGRAADHEAAVGPGGAVGPGAGVGQGAGVDLDAVAVDASTPPVDQGLHAGLGGAVTLACSARPLPAGANGWPYTGQADGADAVPAGAAPPGAPAQLTLIPYHLWGNRGPASMRVWLPEAR
jgi:uncharacterized protein